MGSGVHRNQCMKVFQENSWQQWWKPMEGNMNKKVINSFEFCHMEVIDDTRKACTLEGWIQVTFFLELT